MDMDRNLDDHTNENKSFPSRDEVDFVVVSNNNNYDNKTHNINDNNNGCNSKNMSNTSESLTGKYQISNQNQNQNSYKTFNHNPPVPNKSWLSTHKINKKSKSPVPADGEVDRNMKKDRMSLFSFSKRFNQKTSGANKGDTAAKKNKSDKGKSMPNSNFALTIPTQPTPVPIGTPPRQHKFVKSSSITRLLSGSTYHTNAFDKDAQKRITNEGKFKTYGGRRRSSGPYLERFRNSAKDDTDLCTSKTMNNAVDAEQIDNSTIAWTDDTKSEDTFAANRDDSVSLSHFHGDGTVESSTKAFRSFSRGLGKFWWKRSQSVNISTPDPEFKVSYLGNVLTGWAKGEGCVEKQLSTLWRNYTQNSKPDVIMRIKVCASGLKATTRQHGLTEYWANRITHCCAPKSYPRVFCWIYRHEGRKLKHELRCHAVLCSKEKIVHDICNMLKVNLESALREFKREKILKQNARLSLANAVYDNPSLPRRKILLSVGGNNYRPPLERSKSAPKLMAIEEAIGEEDGDEVEDTNEPEMQACCQKDSLYPAMTLGRRRCRRGHSIRRTGKARPNFILDKHNCQMLQQSVAGSFKDSTIKTKECVTMPVAGETIGADNNGMTSNEQRDNYGSDDSDDFDKLLKQNDYDTKSSLANELLPYFDMQLNKKLSTSLGSLTELKCEEEQPLSLSPTINSHPSADPEAEYTHSLDDPEEIVGLRRNGVCSDGEEDYLDADDAMYFHQASILSMLHRNSIRKMAHLSLSSDESSSMDTNNSASLQYSHQLQSSISSNASSTTTSGSGSGSRSGSGSLTMENAMSDANILSKQAVCKQMTPDSDEGSISSGCETASTVTANQDDISLKYHQQNKQQIYYQDMPGALDDIKMPTEHGFLDEEAPITADEIYQRLECRLQKRHNSDATTFSSSSSITLKVGSSSSLAASLNDVNDVNCVPMNSNATRSRRSRRQSATQRATAAEGTDGDTDSECSDESGYVEYPERKTNVKPGKANSGALSSPSVQQQLQQSQSQSQPQPLAQQHQYQPFKSQTPPKPMPRRSLAGDNKFNNNANTSTVTKTTTAV